MIIFEEFPFFSLLRINVIFNKLINFFLFYQILFAQFDFT